MADDIIFPETVEDEGKTGEVVYNSSKDFYKGMSGELRYKAEGLFKKAKEKGISIEDIDVITLKENSVEFPGIGVMELPAYFVRVKGRHIQSGQVLMDGKQIDYFNRYQEYMADKIERKNVLRDERGKVIWENNKPKVKHDVDFLLSEWERFEIGKNLVDDKAFGLEKTITGACDRIIRKLMGENDWLSPDEARLLDEEFNKVQERIARGQAGDRQEPLKTQKKATDRQVSYLKAKIKNFGLDPDNDDVIKELLKQTGYSSTDIKELSTSDMSRIIDNVSSVMPKVREAMVKTGHMPLYGRDTIAETGKTVKQ